MFNKNPGALEFDTKSFKRLMTAHSTRREYLQSRINKLDEELKEFVAHIEKRKAEFGEELAVVTSREQMLTTLVNNSL